MGTYRIDVEDVPEEIEAGSLDEAEKIVRENISILDIVDIED